MKFCHFLETTSLEVPDRYNTLFIFYKKMKKHLKKLPAVNSGAGAEQVLAAEGEFVEVFVREIGILNDYRVAGQEDSVRTLEALQLSASASGSSVEERQRVYQDLINFHGETLLLMHWSILAYTAIVKLLKKHQKYTGILVQAPHVRDILSQSSWSTEVATRLIERAAATIGQLQLELYGKSPASQGSVGDEEMPPASRRQPSSPTFDNHVLRTTLEALAKAEDMEEDSGEGSTSMQAAEGGREATEDTASLGSCTHNVNTGALGTSAGAAAGSGEGSHGASRSVSGAGPSEAEAQEEHEPVVKHALLQQMQAALTTWEYLQKSASTPSTVLCHTTQP